MVMVMNKLPQEISNSISVDKLLFNNCRKSLQGFTDTIAKFKARLGSGAVYKLDNNDNYVQKLRNVMMTLAEKCHQDLSDIYITALQPAWLLSAPELIQKRHHRLYWHGYLLLLAGPERIIGDWCEKPIAREYYLAKRQDNTPVWVFFNLYTKQWYAHSVSA